LNLYIKLADAQKPFPVPIKIFIICIFNINLELNIKNVKLKLMLVYSFVKKATFIYYDSSNFNEGMRIVLKNFLLRVNLV